LIAPDDIANLALFLASDDSRLITKQTISVEWLDLAPRR